MTKVFISSTSKDLEAYRKAAIDTCIKLDMLPIAMEHFESMGVGATEGSKRKLDEANLYVGFFAFRYGYIEDGYDKSVTEIEFDYAGERGLDRLCFVADPNHRWPPAANDPKNWDKLETFKDRIGRLIRNQFTTVDDFTAKLMHSLVKWKGLGVATDIGKEKLNTYLAIGHLLGLLGKEINIVQDWTGRIKENDEIAELSSHFPASGSIERLRARLTEIEELRIRWRWLLAWKVDFLLYAISLKGKELLTAVECYGSEKSDWQLKRGHLIAASGIATVVAEYASLCSREADEDLRQRKYTFRSTPSDDDAKAFSKVLGDIGRAESKRFSDEHPELAERLRETNRLATEKYAHDFMYKLQCDAILDPEKAGSLNFNPQQRIKFLEQLYGECLGFYFQMWNEPQDEAKEARDQLRLEQLLQRQSTNDILAVFRDMVNTVRKTVAETKPLAMQEFDNQDDFEKAKLVVLRPSAIKYGDLEMLTESHLAELKQETKQ